MAIKEKATTQIVARVLSEATVSGSVNYEGVILDTADYDNGIYFAMSGSITVGEAHLEVQHGDEEDLSDAEDVPTEQLVYPVPVVIDGLVGLKRAQLKQACFGTKRYVRPVVAGVGVTGTNVVVTAVLNPELVPTPQGPYALPPLA